MKNKDINALEGRGRSAEPASGGAASCVIIAAGRGSRLAGLAPSKPLLEVAGKALIDRAIDVARAAGIRRFVVVTGYAGEDVERHLRAKAEAEGVSIATVRNDEWEKENGLSVLKAKGLAGDRFLLVMSDHLFDPALLEGLRRRPIAGDEVILAVDGRTAGNPYVDLDDVTRVRVVDGRIAAIGKRIPEYDVFDTGAFLCTPALFEALEASQARGDYSLSGGIRILAARGRALAWDTGGLFWLDVDDGPALAKAEQAVAAGLVGPAAAPRPAGRLRKRARLLLSGAGLLLLVFLVIKIGAVAVLDQLRRFGPWFLFTTGLAFLWLFLQACAWSIIQAAHFRRVPLLRLFRTKIISDSLNTLLPSANIGGDAARAFLITSHAPLKEGIPGVLVDKTIEAFAAALFLATGFLLSLTVVRLPAWMDVVAAVCLAVTAAGIALFIVLQLKGAAWAIDRLARIFPRVRRLAAGREHHIRELDDNICTIYKHLDLRTVAATALHFAARVLGAVEVYTIMRVLGQPLTAVQALFTSTGVTIINTAFFVVPGQYGVQESAHMLVLRILGFSAALGLSLGVIRRIRKLATSAVGIVLYATHPSAPPREEDRRG
ncbi:MAG TPA: lysylphosphatidylglycerol synthase domain-containing protein [Candidatus Aminicenantes bacterium]|nr:lysylphosphatidylglycerol synthase domain-containing protein [Candidatus Aminicenantes bacterium]HRY64810.1 lysylphosphatidylglycerol synthase domain-containing protein [Candidatus Aminicenantes bacterium]HRZ71723.1 lysylphosphatidylglycerol synthase domain-containing protein [Candidatus Aminicenantes bacterium]